MSLTHRGSFDLSVKTADKLSLATNSGVGKPVALEPCADLSPLHCSSLWLWEISNHLSVL